MSAFVGNTNMVEIIGLRSEVDDSFINDANIIVTVKDRAGVNVSGMNWPIAMDYVADSSGVYRAVLSEELSFVPERKYTAFIDVDGGPNRIGHWEFSFRPQSREK